MQEEKDFFISYNKADKGWAEWISFVLEANGYTCHLQAWDFIPGQNFMLEIEETLSRTKHTLAVLSPDYLDASYTKLEWAATLAQDPTGEKRKLIPIRVRECILPKTLTPIVYVDLINLRESVALNTLLVGVQDTRNKPSKKPNYPASTHEFPGPSNVLIASLGDSPVVVTAMYDLLAQRENIPIDRVVVLHPEGDDIDDGYERIKKALTGKCIVYSEQLPFEDADNWLDMMRFWKDLYKLLEAYQDKGSTVYLSLAGGRKSMAALVAWIAPFFSCIEGLYHVIDPDEKQFPSIDKFNLTMNSLEQQRVMSPNLDRLKLVSIPFTRKQQIDEQLVDQLRGALKRDLLKMEEELFEKAATLWAVEGSGNNVPIKVTATVLKEYDTLGQHNRDAARQVWRYLRSLGNTDILHRLPLESASYTPKKSAKSSSTTLHFFPIPQTAIRTVFYTTPQDINSGEDKAVTKVHICALDKAENGIYKNVREVAASLDLSIEKEDSFEDLIPLAPNKKTESILIVPLGTTPMVATQLYTLIQRQENHDIRKVILVYPELAREIQNGAEIIQDALYEEYKIDCVSICVKNQLDIDSAKACIDYQETLERVIQQACIDFDCVDLALSGGRKGMTAMTIFAAQKQGIPFVYHTLMLTKDKKLNNKIEKETAISDLRALGRNHKKRNARLFLCDYTENVKFVLFKVPVFPAKKSSLAENASQ